MPNILQRIFSPSVQHDRSAEDRAHGEGNSARPTPPRGDQNSHPIYKNKGSARLRKGISDNWSTRTTGGRTAQQPPFVYQQPGRMANWFMDQVPHAMPYAHQSSPASFLEPSPLALFFMGRTPPWVQKADPYMR